MDFHLYFKFNMVNLLNKKLKSFFQTYDLSSKYLQKFQINSKQLVILNVIIILAYFKYYTNNFQYISNKNTIYQINLSFILLCKLQFQMI